MRFTNSRDGVLRCDVRVEFRLDRDALVNGLCAKWVDEYDDLPERRGAVPILRDVKEVLAAKGRDGIDWWSDGVDDDVIETLLEWARPLVDKAFPEARR